ncbi:hypothetical protein SAMN04488515_1891 [Cognatiyoonia koreensis]|uniref:LexA-binding, inner membrane-associated hydrolase n=1 Tax=Cognatiyoonia koreensis TaxID=364200 RepID=A0A1I0QGA4_9RHOB|nr:cobalamin biosynthesis protein CobQ [Cognatiyoonia koreensis]SEW25955.1 hypothetical protein SAMN04488515_1891 [Cognatiyoonia koreensis]
MNTPAHLIFGITAFGRADSGKVTLAAAAGALIPDLSLYVLAGWHLIVLGTDPEIVFGQMYYSEEWQRIFRIDNSFVLWGIALGLAAMLRSKVFIALSAAALLHLLLDFPLHNDDARAHFWPVTNWKFISPVSYWDTRYYGHIVGPVEVAAVLGCCFVLWQRYAHVPAMRVATAAAALLQISPVIVWMLFFGGV